ncbi:MAG: glutaredoxin family protein [Actinomycetota bacterium]|nr:glutaredoxin family protein [Actinomycetota bacterium]
MFPGELYCDRTEEFLREKGVEPTVRNIAEDEEAMAELERMGTMTTPVAVIGGEAGEEVVVGFDRPRLERALGL